MHAHTRPEAPSRLPAGTTLTGELSSDHDFFIEGIFEGQISLPEQHLMIAASARVKARIIARAVTIAGRLEGNVTATQRARIEPGADVQAMGARLLQAVAAFEAGAEPGDDQTLLLLRWDGPGLASGR